MANNHQLAGEGLHLAPTPEAVRIPEIIVYEHGQFQGDEWRSNLSYSYVGDDWNDRISSIVVVSGTWEFFEHKDFQGTKWTLGPGYYGNFGDLGICNDCLSSFRAISY